MSDKKSIEKQEATSPFELRGSGRFGPKTIQARLPTGLGDTKRRCGVACVRNPDAELADIVELLKRDPDVNEDVVLGTLGQIVDAEANTLPKTTAEVYERLGIEDTDEKKYVTVIEWLAKNNQRFNVTGYRGSLPQEKAADKITEDTGVSVSSGLLSHVGSKRTALLALVRLVIAVHQRDVLNGTPRDAFEITVRESGIRPLLSALDYDLPPRNLDMAPKTPKTEQKTIEAVTGRQHDTADEPSAVGADGGAVATNQPESAGGRAGSPEGVETTPVELLNTLVHLNQRTQQGVETLLMRDAANSDELHPELQLAVMMLQNATDATDAATDRSFDPDTNRVRVEIEYTPGGTNTQTNAN